MNDNYLDSAQYVFDREIEGLISLKNNLGESFNRFVDEIDSCKGHIIFMGVGKSGHICQKIVATMQSLGIKTFFLHPTESLHGDLGSISKEDIVIGVSNSGETSELLGTIPSIRIIGARLFCIVGRENCTLSRSSEITLLMPNMKEVFLDNMVPTTSTTATLVLGDALAVCIAEKRGFTKSEFGIYHPNGTLGKKLTIKVSDIMSKDIQNTSVPCGSTIRETVVAMCGSSMGGICVVKDDQLQGVFTDGDLRRHLNKYGDKALEYIVDDVMTRKCTTLDYDTLAYDAIERTVTKSAVSFYPVLKDGKYAGAIRTLDFVHSGLMK